jgi:putative endonuclease
VRASDVLGRFGEDAAARFLTEQGFTVLDRNWRCDVGEIDIVALDGDTLVICEVKTRRGVGFGAPLEAVTPAKAARLARLAAAYRRGQGTGARACRIDLVGVLLQRGQPMQIEHLRGVA